MQYDAGSLTIAPAIFPGSLEPTAEGFNLILYGGAEIAEDQSMEA